MNANKPIFKYCLILLFMGIGNLTFAQKKDVWTGSYVIKSVKTDTTESVILDTVIIEKAPDINPKKEPSRFEHDIARWTIMSIKEKGEKIIVRRFLFDVENDEDEYKEFSWTDLHKNGKLECIDAGHFFICQTEPNSVVKFNKEESYLTRTGIFGIRLHFGVFDLERIK